ncbi:hypothetical protein L1987_61474 [Smallanthus sonchifolius]|uniref:Uncharacterized protein n=1 Tax=Smallanthus sonchifolius TaxID=185202 RepID=A0ACB9C7U1_9ASTR|nr:hypothetical protein L1987_61474 [Smallanthus sonchifolius]
MFRFSRIHSLPKTKAVRISKLRTNFTQTLIGTYQQSFPPFNFNSNIPSLWMENSHSTCEESIVFHSFAFHHRYKYEDGGTFGLQSRLGFHSKLDLLGLNLRLDFLYSE